MEVEGLRRVSVCSSLIFCETGEVTLIWSGTSSLTSWASWNATSWIVLVCEVREIWVEKKHDISVNKENGKITTRLALMTKWADSFTSLMTFCCWIAGNLYGTSGMMCL